MYVYVQNCKWNEVNNPHEEGGYLRRLTITVKTSIRIIIGLRMNQIWKRSKSF